MTERELQDVIFFLEEMPESVRRLTAPLSNRELRRKPSKEEFSALEQICHLRDLEREGYSVRINKLLAEDDPLLPDFDGSRIARERDYNSQDFETAREAFTQARAENVRVLRGLSPRELKRKGTLDGFGEITLKGLLFLMREHDLSHREELGGLAQAFARGKA
jgi:hypothetical protein